MKLLIKYATRARLKLFFQTLELLRSNATTRPHFLIAIDEDDILMNSTRSLSRLSEMHDVTVVVGTSKTKVEAINTGFSEYQGEWDVVLVASDDHIPVVQGYDQTILDDMAAHFHDTDGELWYRDPRQDMINFVPIMGRKRYESLGYIYHPAYCSLWCDNEQTEVALRDGKIHRSEVQLFSNESPDWGGGIPRDPLYQRNNRFYKADKLVYEQRKAAGFP